MVKKLSNKEKLIKNHNFLGSKLMPVMIFQMVVGLWIILIR